MPSMKTVNQGEVGISLSKGISEATISPLLLTVDHWWSYYRKSLIYLYELGLRSM